MPHLVHVRGTVADVDFKRAGPSELRGRKGVELLRGINAPPPGLLLAKDHHKLVPAYRRRVCQWCIYRIKFQRSAHTMLNCANLPHFSRLWYAWLDVRGECCCSCHLQWVLLSPASAWRCIGSFPGPARCLRLWQSAASLLWSFSLNGIYSLWTERTTLRPQDHNCCKINVAS